MYYSTSTADQPTISDSIVESVINKYKHRSELGIEKYGVTMDRNDLTDVELFEYYIAVTDDEEISMNVEIEYYEPTTSR